MTTPRKVGADEAPAQQGGRAEYALLAAADGETAALLEARLATLREELLRTAAAAATVELDQTTQGRLSRMDAMQQQAMAAGLAERLRTEIRKTEAALVRVADGSYGECCRCGTEIPPARLAADPAAPFCADCVRGYR